jgi:RNA polymerase sigma-70 factor, ECF subfamily
MPLCFGSGARPLFLATRGSAKQWVQGKFMRATFQSGPCLKKKLMVDDPVSDVELMLQVQHGDLTAFEGLVERYKQPLFNMVYRMLRDADEAEDIVQKVFVQVYKASDRYRPTAQFSTWIFTIARNLTLNEIRRRSRKPPLDSMDAAAEPEGVLPPREYKDIRGRTAGEETMQRELLERIDIGISELPENQKAAMLLCKEGDLRYEEIAKALGCSVSAVKSLLFRARETLKRRIKHYLQTGAWSD